MQTDGGACLHWDQLRGAAGSSRCNAMCWVTQDQRTSSNDNSVVMSHYSIHHSLHYNLHNAWLQRYRLINDINHVWFLTCFPRIGTVMRIKQSNVYLKSVSETHRKSFIHGSVCLSLEFKAAHSPVEWTDIVRFTSTTTPILSEKWAYADFISQTSAPKKAPPLKGAWYEKGVNNVFLKRHASSAVEFQLFGAFPFKMYSNIPPRPMSRFVFVLFLIAYSDTWTGNSLKHETAFAANFWKRKHVRFPAKAQELL